jgi:TrmH family RNA methyltransferase
MSRDNPYLKDIRRALERGSLTGDGFCVIEGFHLLAEALRGLTRVTTVLSPEPPAGLPVGAEWVHVPEAVLARIGSTETSPGVLALVEWKPRPVPPGLTVYLDRVQDPGNVGTIARSAEAFGAAGLLFGPGTAHPHHPKVLRASAGSLFRLPWEYREPEGSLYSADPHQGIPIAEADWSRPVTLLAGSEAHGVRPELAARARKIRIPTQGVESLNVAVAISIVLYEARRGTV